MQESRHLCARCVLPCTRFLPPVHRPRRWTTLPPRWGAALAVPTAASQPVGRSLHVSASMSGARLRGRRGALLPLLAGAPREGTAPNRPTYMLPGKGSRGWSRCASCRDPSHRNVQWFRGGIFYGRAGGLRTLSIPLLLLLFASLHSEPHKTEL